MRIGCIIRTPDIDVGGYNLRKAFLRWIYFPVNDPIDKDHFLIIEKGIILVDANSTSLNELLKMLPDSGKNDDETTRLVKAKEIDYIFTFSVSKIRAVVSCDVCNALQCIFQ